VQQRQSRLHVQIFDDSLHIRLGFSKTIVQIYQCHIAVTLISAEFRKGKRFKLCILDERFNFPVQSAPVKSDFEAVQLSGSEATAVIRTISDPLVKVLVILVAITGTRISAGGHLGLHRLAERQNPNPPEVERTSQGIWRAGVCHEPQAR
jgi:hypothetical protein